MASISQAPYFKQTVPISVLATLNEDKQRTCLATEQAFTAEHENEIKLKPNLRAWIFAFLDPSIGTQTLALKKDLLKEKSRNGELEDKVAYLKFIIAKFSSLITMPAINVGFPSLHRQNLETIHVRAKRAILSVSYL